MTGAMSKQPDAVLSEQARQALGKTESGNATGARQLEDVHKSDPAGAEAAEQEASDGPEGRGLSR